MRSGIPYVKPGQGHGHGSERRALLAWPGLGTQDPILTHTWKPVNPAVLPAEESGELKTHLQTCTWASELVARGELQPGTQSPELSVGG